MIRTHALRLSSVTIGLTCLALLFACGGGSSTPPPPPPISVSLHPQATSVIAGTQPQQFTAAVTNDSQGRGVTWSVDGVAGGSAAVGTISAAGLYVPPATAGTHTLKATSVADNSKSASATIGVTDLPGILTYHYNPARDGVNSHEFALSPSTVHSATFGLIFSCPVDGAIYAEPLWVSAVNVNGTTHNVVLVTTQHDSLYAFDGDGSSCQQLWHVNLIDPAHGGSAGETPVCWADVGSGFGDIQPEIGTTGTGVIDPGLKALYVVSKSETGGCTTGTASTFFQRLHGIDIATGNEIANSPVAIAASVIGNGDGSSGGVVNFNAQSEGQRLALALLNNVPVSGALFKVVVVGWASHEDAFPYHGWLIGYNATNLQQRLEVFNTTPNGGLGGMWMSGGGPAVDANNNLYVATGNGTFDADLGGSDYGDSVLRISSTGAFSLADYFTPNNQIMLNQFDGDLGSGGVVLLPDQTVGPTHLLIQGGKQGLMYLLDRDNMGHFHASSDSVVQEFQADNGSWTTPALWQNTMFIAGSGDHGSCDSLKAYKFTAGAGFDINATSASAHCFPFPGATPVVSSAGNSNGVVWAMDVGCFSTAASPCAGSAILYAYDASNLGNHLWDSSQAPGQRDKAGAAVKFAVPTVANGKVYIGTRTELDAYGLLP